MNNKFKIIMIIIVIGFTTITCSNNEPSITITQRYETVPISYSYNKTDNSKKSNNTQGLIYSWYDNNNYYYVFLLGHVNFVPLAYRDAIYYNGKTPITIGYTKSSITENSITKAMTTTIENTVTDSYDLSSVVSSEISAKIFGIGSKVKAQISGEYSWADIETRSFSDTIETTMTKINECGDTISATIGNNNEEPGRYRYSLFATTDIYYIAQVNKTSFKIKDSYYEVCARPETFAWGIDYEPDPTGNFGKTSDGDLLAIPKVDFSTLPIPTDYYGETPNDTKSGDNSGTSNDKGNGQVVRPGSSGGTSPVEITITQE